MFSIGRTELVAMPGFLTAPATPDPAISSFAGRWNLHHRSGGDLRNILARLSWQWR
jgi:hypothetical protein